MSETVAKEALRRRTFAIISHPDAGKTTLTEKLLLYGGALHLAGSVTAKKKQRETASDWMELEKKRGISISSTVLQFEYGDFRLNLLDTPGHKDFSEDTYRVLMAVDAVVMVIDAAKGIESQTRKLFEICRKRGIPIFTFMNKLDRPSKAPLELIDQLEKVLSIHAYPVTWPLGDGADFKGVYDRMKKEVHLFERVPGGAFRAPVQMRNLDDPLIKELFTDSAYQEIAEELELLECAQEGFDLEAVLQGRTTPVFFGSATNNFGVEMLLTHFVDHAPAPQPRATRLQTIPLDYPYFSSFIFKVQTNMNPQHRDRVVFARVCSGKFDRDIKVFHPGSGREVRLSDSFSLFGRGREFTAEAYPGDIIGFVTKLDFRIGDTISTDPKIRYEEIPRFAPECFGFLHHTTASAYKSFRKGIDHLLAEDIVQPFTLPDSQQTTPLLGAVGPLQFEVLQYRLKDEYKADSRLEMARWNLLRWIESELDDEMLKKCIPFGAAVAYDDQRRRVILFESEWSLKYCAEKHPAIQFFDSPPAAHPA
jgi:peptide chain release factor 3